MFIVGVDFGLKRIGLAKCETGVTFALPWKTVEIKQDAVKEVLAQLQLEEVESFVVGLPLRMNGTDSESTRAARRFAEQLQQASHKPVHLFDERLSSKQAEQALIDAGFSPSKKKGRVDRSAATFILQSYLDSL